jgi:excisionase family DNA binding protein
MPILNLYMTEHAWLSTKESAVLLGVSQRTIQNWVDVGKLPSTRTLGGHRRLVRSDVEKLLILRGMGSSNSESHGFPDAAAHVSELRVLVVESDWSILRLCELNFSQFSIPHRLFLASNGYQGLVLAGKHSPHLIFTDLKLPEMNGLQFIQEIRNTTDMKESKIVVTTALETADIMKMGVFPEDVMILPKPIPFQTIETIFYQQNCALINRANASKKN